MLASQNSKNAQNAEKKCRRPPERGPRSGFPRKNAQSAETKPPEAAEKMLAKRFSQNKRPKHRKKAAGGRRKEGREAVFLLSKSKS